MSDSDSLVLSLCDEVWQWRLKESPELASFCGVHQYDDQWDDISEEAYIRRKKCVQDFLSKIKNIDASSCTPKVALSYALLKEDLELYLKGSHFKSYLMPINYLEGIHTDCNLTISSYMKFETEKDYKIYLQRLENLPKRINQVQEALKQGVNEGIVLHYVSVFRVPAQIEELISTPLHNHNLLSVFSKTPGEIPEKVLQEFKNKAEELLTAKVFPAFQNLKNYIEMDYMQHLRKQEGISSLNDGSQWYQQCLDFHLSCSVSFKEVHDLGIKEVARIEEEILKVAKEEGLGQTMSEILGAIKQRQQEFTCKDELQEYVKDICFNKIRPKISLLFKDLPDIKMTIKPAPEYMKNSPAGYYFNGTPDGTRDGVFYFNAHNLQDCLSFELPALCLHEGEPGHHLQNTFALAAKDLPDFRRYSEDSKYYLPPGKFSFHTAYVEGWGLYSEFLGEELNLFENKFDLLGRYSFEIFRAARLVVDTGLHAMGWSKEQALQYMEAHTLMSRAELTNEIDRYITWPGQACAYKIGELKIKELRSKAEAALRDKFDIKEFHHCILSCGNVPLRVLESLVDEFIRNVQHSL